MSIETHKDPVNGQRHPGILMIWLILIWIIYSCV
jgi:hypothetical protein